MPLIPPSNPDYSRPIELAGGVYWVGFYDEQSGSQANPYLVVDGNEGVVIDGGSRSAFPKVMIKILQTGISPSSIKALVYQNYDPRLCGSIPHLEGIINRPDLQIVSDESNHKFIQHYSESATFLSLGNIEHQLRFSSGRRLLFIRTPYAHSAGSFITFDEKTGILFTSDLFSGYMSHWSLFLELSVACRECQTFDLKLPCMQNSGACPVWEIMDFHRHIMTSERALRLALEQIAHIPFSVIAPQHGSVIHNPGDIILICQCLASLKGVGIDQILGDRAFSGLGDIEPIRERFGKAAP
jgi:flavorubredoxin